MCLLLTVSALHGVVHRQVQADDVELAGGA